MSPNCCSAFPRACLSHSLKIGVVLKVVAAGFFFRGLSAREILRYSCDPCLFKHRRIKTVTARPGAARIEQQRKELPGEVSAVDVGVERVAVAAVGPPVAGLTKRVKTLRRLEASPACSGRLRHNQSHQRMSERFCGSTGWWRRNRHQHLIQLRGGKTVAAPHAAETANLPIPAFSPG